MRQIRFTGSPMFALFGSPAGARSCPPGGHLESVVARRAEDVRPLGGSGLSLAGHAQGCAEVYFSLSSCAF